MKPGMSMTIDVLFVCTANICRSPMAEGAFRSMARHAGLEAAFFVDSAGTFDGHVGQPPTWPAIRTAARRGYDIARLRARLVKETDILHFDYVVAMGRGHLFELRAIAPPKEFDRLRLLSEFCPPGSPVDVADPYGRSDRDYEEALDLIEAGCRGLLEALEPYARKATSAPAPRSGSRR
jgi:protein-tyrosine phosphatase